MDRGSALDPSQRSVIILHISIDKQLLPCFQMQGANTKAIFFGNRKPQDLDQEFWA